MYFFVFFVSFVDKDFYRNKLFQPLPMDTGIAFPFGFK